MESVTLDDLVLEDLDAFGHIALYADLEKVLRRAKYRFRLLPASHEGRWDRALFLNLTYWAANEGGDTLTSRSIPADVVAHVAWHHLANGAVGSSSAAAMFLGESIASAFDLYLVGRMLGRRGRSSFLETQVPAMAEAAQAAGLSEKKFEKLLGEVASDPERAFGDLRTLLFDATHALHACGTAEEAQSTFARFEGHRFGALLHHYELSNWVLFARAHAKEGEGTKAAEIAQLLATEAEPLQWLERHWVVAALG